MPSDLLFQARQNRLIATGRVFQALFSLASVLVNPDRPGVLDNIVVGIVVAYTVLSGLTLLLAQNWNGDQNKLFMAGFAMDAVIFSIVLYLTAGSTSPFFNVFLTLVLGATLQWGWRGAVGATAMSLLIFLPTCLPAYERLLHAPFDAPRFIIRVGTLLSVGGLLIAFGRHQERIGRDMLRLAGPGPLPTASEQPPIAACLEHALAVFDVAEGIFVWGDPEEPGLRVAELTQAGLTSSTWPLDRTEAHPVFADIDEPFLFDPAGPRGLKVDAQGRVSAPPLAVLESPILKKLAIRRSLVMPVRASSFAGWMILPEAPAMGRELLYLGSTVAAQLSVAVESWLSLMAWRNAASAQERVRLARDLHDGILQFLAGTAMQLEVLGRGLGKPESESSARIGRLQESLRAEQRHLREIIDALGPAEPRGETLLDLAEAAPTLVAMLKGHWDIEVTISPNWRPGMLPRSLTFEVLQILREAVSNAARHGEATAVTVSATTSGDRLQLEIADNGHGLPMHGTFGMDELGLLALGPRMMRARVQALAGDLAITSDPQGMRLSIALPVPSRAPAPWPMAPGLALEGA
jgi:signal transduction histidine kinase